MESRDYRLAAILYTDIAGFSEIMEKNEASALELLDSKNHIIEDIAAAKNGRIIKTVGDAFLIDFKNTVDALQCALEIQHRLYGYNKEHPDLPLLVRIGAHLGDIYFYENDALGEGVHIAALLRSMAHPGCICISQDVYNHVLNKVEFKAEKLAPEGPASASKAMQAYEIATPNTAFDPHRRAAAVPGPEGEEKAAAVKRLILLDVKAAGRRLGADQMRIRYGSEGPVAEAVIDELVSKGLLLRKEEKTEDLFRAVSDIEYRFEDEVRKGLHAALESRRERTAERSARRAERHAAKHGEGRWETKLSESSFRTKADGLQDFKEYAHRVQSESRSAKAAFIGHLIPFIAVNGGLMALNAAVSPSFPWAIFPFGGWAIGLLEHYASVLRRGERARELEKLPPLEADALSLFKSLQKKKDSIWLHLTSSISTTAFLAAINIVVSPQHLWFLFPAVGMGIGLASHAAAYANKKAELERELLDSLGLSGSWSRALAKMPSSLREAPVDFGPYRPLVEEARALRLAVAELADAGKRERKGRKAEPSAAGVDENLLPSVDSFVEQVALLAKRTYEADRIMELIPLDALRADKEALLAKLRSDPGEQLRREYEKSLSELEKQETSYGELKDQREMLELRLRSSVMTLKQLRIDLARLSGMPSSGENAAANAMRDKTLELNRYLSDLRAGYAELEALEARAFPSPRSRNGD